MLVGVIGLSISMNASADVTSWPVLGCLIASNHFQSRRVGRLGADCKVNHPDELSLRRPDCLGDSWLSLTVFVGRSKPIIWKAL
jgi:hypothetical protein